MNKGMRGVFKQDGSLEKQRRVEVERKKREVGVIKAKNRLLGKNEIFEMFKKQAAENEKLKELISIQSWRAKEVEFYDLGSIVKIQANVRGWICRKDYEIVREN